MCQVRIQAAAAACTPLLSSTSLCLRHSDVSIPPPFFPPLTSICFACRSPSMEAQQPLRCTSSFFFGSLCHLSVGWFVGRVGAALLSKANNCGDEAPVVLHALVGSSLRSLLLLLLGHLRRLAANLTCSR
eukprot:TRINITY_DN45_c0_g1_i1.p1 TRINITY_DN45_c0_g1~~TRINITY_DN45_c0_g1_i1.p1  ORF type:complete len:130 (+),score=14.61 TRINITY_DN45_c0_g1_i1:107-496(+)